MLSEVTTTFNLSDYIGGNYDPRRTKVYLTTNAEKNRISDTSTGEIRLGGGTVTLAADGAVSATTWAPGVDANPVSWQTTFNIDYVDAATRKRQTVAIGPFTITTSGLLTALDVEQTVPAEYLTTVTQQLDTKVTAAEVARAGAEAAEAAAVGLVTSDLGTTDGQTRALIDDPNSQTSAALSASTGAIVAAYNPADRRVARIARNVARADGQNAEERPVLAAPPTITTATSNPDGALSNQYRMDTTPSVFTWGGGTPINYAGNGYFRVPVVTLPTGSGNVVGSRSANAWYVEMVTDAPKLLLHFLAQVTEPGVWFEVDGQAVGTTTPFPATSGNAFYSLDFGSSKIRRVRCWTNKAAGFMRAYVGPTYKVWAPPPAPVMALVGDSNGANTVGGLGSGALRPQGFSAQLGQMIGYDDVRQVALGGTGFVATGSFNSTYGDATRIADVVAANPEIVMLNATTNDVGQAGVQAAALAALQAYREALPDAFIIVTGLWGGRDGTTSGKLASENAVKAAFDQFADPLSLWIPTQTSPAGAWVTGTGTVDTPTASGNADRFADDADGGVHPTQGAFPTIGGHEYLARRYAAVIRSTFLPLNDYEIAPGTPAAPVFDGGSF